MLRVAVIGLGGIGNTHTNWYSKNPDSELVALCDMMADRVDPVAAQYGVPAYHTIAEMLEAEQIDAVSVCTAGPENGGHHYEPVMQCLRAGKHVLVEKPISNNIEQARDDGQACQGARPVAGREPQPPLHACRRSRQAVAGRWLAGRCAVRQHGAVDQQSQRIVALVPHARAAPTLDRRDALPLAVQIVKVQAFMHKGPGRNDLVECLGQYAVRERRGRTPDRQL